jgi:uncharacterized membrane protein HdeD (DUF308 family)
MIRDFAKRCEKSMLVSTVITLVLGIVLVFEPSGSIQVLTAIVAILAMLAGGFQIVDYIRQSRQEKMLSLSLVLGIMLLSIGIYLIYNLKSLVIFFTNIIGIALCIKSLFKIQYAFNIRDLSDKWLYNLVVGLISMILGLLLLINPFKSAELFLRIIGVILVLSSIAELVETIMVIKSLDIKEVDDSIEIPFKEKNE